MRPIFDRALELRHSHNPMAKQALFLATLLADNSPWLPDEHLLSHHLFIRGIPGSGKTSFIEYLVELLLSRGPCRMQIYDVKSPATRSLFAAAQIGAARSGIRVKWFTNQIGRHSHTFVFHKQRFMQRLDPSQKTALTCTALGVSHGLEGYGKQVFGGIAFAILLAVYERWEIENWIHLLDRINLVLRKKYAKACGLDEMTMRSATQLINDVGRLARIPAFNTPHSSIDLSDDEPEVVIWNYYGAYDLAGGMARAALFASFEAAQERDSKLRNWLVIDEFQRVVGNSLELVFQQARDRFGLILACQNLADLDTRDKDYAPTVLNCCRLGLTFNVTDPAEIKLLSETSGKVIRERPAMAVSNSAFRTFTGRTKTWSEYEADRLGINDIRLASATAGLALAACNQDHGFVQFGGFPQIVQVDHHITREEYERRRNLPWPGHEEGTILGVMPPKLALPGEEPQRQLPTNIVNPEQRKLPRRAPRNPRP